MNLERASVVLRSRSPLEVVELSLVFTRNLRPDVTRRLSVIFLLPVLALSLSAHYAFGWSWLWTTSATLIACWALELPFLVFAGVVLFDQKLTVRDVLRQSGSLSGRFLLVVLFQLLLTVLLLPTAVGPFFALATYCFATEVVVLERATAGRGIARARLLLRGRSGTGVQTIFLKGCLTVACVLCAEALGQSLWNFVLDIDLESDSLLASGGSPYALFGLVLSVPLTSYYRFLSYINERTLLDGWDIQVAFLAVSRGSRQSQSAQEAA